VPFPGDLNSCGETTGFQSNTVVGVAHDPHPPHITVVELNAVPFGTKKMKKLRKSHP